MTAAIVHLPDELQIALRPHAEDDIGYIMRSWKESLKRSASMSWARDGEVYRALNVRCDKLFAKLGATVACNPELESQMLGWVVLDRERNLLHYVYVLKAFRRNGIARALLAGLQEPIACTSWSDDCEWLQQRMRLEYRPSLIE